MSLYRKKILFFASVLTFAFVVFFTTINDSFSFEKIEPSFLFSSSVKKEADLHQESREPVYTSIFNFIANCNPFKPNKTQ